MERFRRSKRGYSSSTPSPTSSSNRHNNSSSGEKASNKDSPTGKPRKGQKGAKPPKAAKKSSHQSPSSVERKSSTVSSVDAAAYQTASPSIVPVEPNRWGLVRVYLGDLNPQTVYKTVLVSPETTSTEVLTTVFETVNGLPINTSVGDYCLQESQDGPQGSYYRVLAALECPLVVQNKWDPSGGWSFKLSWRSKQIEDRVRTPLSSRRDMSPTPVSMVMERGSRESVPDSFTPSMRARMSNHTIASRHMVRSGCEEGNDDDLNSSGGSDRNSTGRNFLERILHHHHNHQSSTTPHSSDGRQKAATLHSLTPEQWQKYLEISNSISSPERQLVPSTSSRRESFEVPDFESSFGESSFVSQHFSEQDANAPHHFASQGDSSYSQYYHGDSPSHCGIQSTPTFRSHMVAPGNRYGNKRADIDLQSIKQKSVTISHVARRPKTKMMHKRRLVKSSHMTSDFAIVRKERIEKEIETEKPKHKEKDQESIAEETGVVKETRTLVEGKKKSDTQSCPKLSNSSSCPSFQEKWQLLDVEISAALVPGMAGLMNQVVSEMEEPNCSSRDSGVSATSQFSAAIPRKMLVRRCHSLTTPDQNQQQHLKLHNFAPFSALSSALHEMEEEVVCERVAQTDHQIEEEQIQHRTDLQPPSAVPTSDHTSQTCRPKGENAGQSDSGFDEVGKIQPSPQVDAEQEFIELERPPQEMCSETSNQQESEHDSQQQTTGQNESLTTSVEMPPKVSLKLKRSKYARREGRDEELPFTSPQDDVLQDDIVCPTGRTMVVLKDPTLLLNEAASIPCKKTVASPNTPGNVGLSKVPDFASTDEGISSPSPQFSRVSSSASTTGSLGRSGRPAASLDHQKAASSDYEDEIVCVSFSDGLSCLSNTDCSDLGSACSGRLVEREVKEFSNQLTKGDHSEPVPSETAGLPVVKESKPMASEKKSFSALTSVSSAEDDYNAESCTQIASSISIKEPSKMSPRATSLEPPAATTDGTPKVVIEGEQKHKEAGIGAGRDTDYPDQQNTSSPVQSGSALQGIDNSLPNKGDNDQNTSHSLQHMAEFVPIASPQTGAARLGLERSSGGNREQEWTRLGEDGHQNRGNLPILMELTVMRSKADGYLSIRAPRRPPSDIFQRPLSKVLMEATQYLDFDPSSVGSSQSEVRQDCSTKSTGAGQEVKEQCKFNGANSSAAAEFQPNPSSSSSSSTVAASDPLVGTTMATTTTTGMGRGSGTATSSASPSGSPSNTNVSNNCDSPSISVQSTPLPPTPGAAEVECDLESSRVSETQLAEMTLNTPSDSSISPYLQPIEQREMCCKESSRGEETTPRLTHYEWYRSCSNSGDEDLCTLQPAVLLHTVNFLPPLPQRKRIPVLEREVDPADSESLLHSGSDHGFIDDEDDLLPPFSVTPGSPATSLATTSVATSTFCPVPGSLTSIPPGSVQPTSLPVKASVVKLSQLQSRKPLVLSSVIKEKDNYRKSEEREDFLDTLSSDESFQCESDDDVPLDDFDLNTNDDDDDDDSDWSGSSPIDNEVHFTSPDEPLLEDDSFLCHPLQPSSKIVIDLSREQYNGQFPFPLLSIIEEDSAEEDEELEYLAIQGEQWQEEEDMKEKVHSETENHERVSSVISSQPAVGEGQDVTSRSVEGLEGEEDGDYQQQCDKSEEETEMAPDRESQEFEEVEGQEVKEEETECSYSQSVVPSLEVDQEPRGSQIGKTSEMVKTAEKDGHFSLTSASSNQSGRVHPAKSGAANAVATSSPTAAVLGLAGGKLTKPRDKALSNVSVADIKKRLMQGLEARPDGDPKPLVSVTSASQRTTSNAHSSSTSGQNVTADLQANPKQRQYSHSHSNIESSKTVRMSFTSKTSDGDTTAKNESRRPSLTIDTSPSDHSHAFRRSSHSEIPSPVSPLYQSQGNSPLATSSSSEKSHTPPLSDSYRKSPDSSLRITNLFSGVRRNSSSNKVKALSLKFDHSTEHK